MPVLGLISGMQAGLGPLSWCHSGVPALQRSQSRHIPFVSARRSLFTFHWLDIPIRAADYLLAASSSSSPSTRHCAVSHLFFFLCHSFCLAMPIQLFFSTVLVLTVCHSFSLTFAVTLSSTHGFDYQEVNNLDSRYIIKWFTWHHAEQEAVLARERTRLIMCSNTCLTNNVCYFNISVCASGLNTQP